MLLTKTYSIASDVYRFEFKYREDFYGELDNFEIMKLGEKQIGFEDRDETLIYPSFLEIEISDHEWKNHTIINELKKLYQFPFVDLNLFTVSVYKNDALWYKGIVNKLTQKWDEYTLKIQLTTTTGKLNNIRVDNPYILDYLRQTGDLQPETLKNTGGVVFPNAYAFGGIGNFSGTLLRGFIIYQPAGYTKPVLTLSYEDFPRTTDPNLEKKLGFAKFKNFFKALLRFINPDIEITVKHDWTFGPDEAEIEDLYLYFLYRDVFGRVIMISKEIYNTLDSRIFDSDALRSAAEKIWDDNNWIAWKINISGSIVTGDSERSVMQSLKKIVRGFYSRLYIKDLDNAVIYKKGFTGTRQVSGSEILPESTQYTQQNKIKFVRISWREKQIATRGEDTALLTDTQKLQYSVMFGATDAVTAHLIVLGFSGFPAGSGVDIYLPAYGNLFYRTATSRVFALRVNDPNYPSQKKLVELLAELEYNTKKNDRDGYDVELDGTDFKFEENLTFTCNEKIFGTASVLQMRENAEEFKTTISGVGI